MVEVWVERLRVGGEVERLRSWEVGRLRLGLTGWG